MNPASRRFDIRISSRVSTACLRACPTATMDFASLKRACISPSCSMLNTAGFFLFGSRLEKPTRARAFRFAPSRTSRSTEGRTGDAPGFDCAVAKNRQLLTRLYALPVLQ